MKSFYRFIGALVASVIVIACGEDAQSPQNSTGDPPPGVSTASGAMGSASPSTSSSSSTAPPAH